MRDPKHIDLKVSEAVARLTLSRPRHNVMNLEMMKEIVSCLEALAADPTLKCIVVLGQGRSWCAGVDVGDHRPETAPEMIGVFNRIFQIIHGLPVPLIAAVHGAALGGGMELAIACDMIIAAQSATFGQPEIKLGFLPPYAAIRLPELVGPAKAVEICTTGRIYSAAEAQALGFVGTVVQDDGFADCLARVLGDITACSPLILRLNKRAVTEQLGKGFSSALEDVGDLFLNTLIKTEDTLEGIASFYEKRKPVWKNR